MSDIGKKMTQATKWSAITEIAVKLVTPVTNMLLARILMPEDFGVVATLTMVVSFAEIFTDAGFQKYIVQHDFADEAEEDLSTNVAFWTNLAFSLLLWGMIAVFAEPLAGLVGSAGKGDAIIVISAQIPLLAFSSIQMARYRREFDFKSLFVIRMATALVPLAITVPLALIFRSYWALVWGTLAKDILNAVILTVRSGWKPRAVYSFRKLKEMFSFTFWTIVENVFLWLTGYLDVFIVGIALNEHYLGLYKTAMSTVNSFMGIITAATMPVLFSTLSRYQNDDRQFRETFLRFQRGAALVLCPIGIGIYVYRDLAVAICLGDQWTEITDFFGLWAFTSSIVIILSHYDSEAFRSKGKPKLSVLSQCAHLACMIPLLLWSTGKSFEVLCVTRCLLRLPGIAASACIMHFAVGIKIPSIVKNVLPSLASAFVMALVGSGLQRISGSIVWQFVSIPLCAAVYAVCMYLLPEGKRQLAEIPILRKLLHINADETEL